MMNQQQQISQLDHRKGERVHTLTSVIRRTQEVRREAVADLTNADGEAGAEALNKAIMAVTGTTREWQIGAEAAAEALSVLVRPTGTHRTHRAGRSIKPLYKAAPLH